MKSKGRIAGGSGGGGIVIEATNRKARRKEQRHAKKKQKQPTKRKTVDPSLTSSSSRGSTYIANKKQKKDDTREGISSNNNDDKRVQFSNTIQEKTIPSVKNHIPVGLKKKKSSTLAQESDDDEYEQSTTLSTNSKSSNRYYQNLDIETATALHADDVEIEYLESNLGIKKSSKKKKMNSISQELNKEYAKNEGFGDDFGTFLLGLDSLVDRCMGGGKDDDDDDDDAESGSEDNNDESENDTIDRLEVTARVRRKFTIEEIQDEDLYNYVPIPEIEKQTQGVLEKKQRNIDEVLVKYSNQQQHNVRGRQAAANLPADSGAKLRVPKERCDTELKSFHQVNK